MKWHFEKFMPLIGRILIGSLFLVAGFMKIFQFESTVNYMIQHGITQMVQFFLGLAILIEILGGLSIILGAYAEWGAFFLLLFLFPATMIFHTKFTNSVEIWMFMKNIALMGSLAYIIGMGSGAFSLDSLWRKEEEEELPLHYQLWKKKGGPLAPAHGLDPAFYNPFSLLQNFFSPFSMPTFWEDMKNDKWGPISSEIYEEDKDVVVELALPGIKPDNLNIEVQDNYLKIEGEFEERSKNKNKKVYETTFRKGSFSEILTLPAEVDGSQAKADYHNGILKIRLPKKEHARERKTIPLTIGS
ncbi:MAG: DoxX family membrane protein [Planctomycetota bacterium]|nr:MAG: DoxX family membrane protein [Planctomycetota bacterium]